MRAIKGALTGGYENAPTINFTELMDFVVTPTFSIITVQILIHHMSRCRGHCLHCVTGDAGLCSAAPHRLHLVAVLSPLLNLSRLSCTISDDDACTLL
jgi:hypothetical protein